MIRRCILRNVIALVRWSVLGLLLALRLPSLVQPVAADQSLYTYIGLRILAGEAPYVDAWDQKPPGVHLLYAVLWWLWPDERVVNVADLGAAIGVCWLLVVLGRRVATPAAGWLSACIFALLANPSMHRLSGVFQRGQCETFIALAVTGALVLATVRTRRRAAMIGAGLLLGVAIWLKYNAVVFVLPVVVAAWWWGPDRHWRGVTRDLAHLTAGAAALGAIGLGWLAWHGALTDLWLATFDYNVAYSSAGYGSPGAAFWYILSMPIRQARHELLWLLGLAGVLFGLAVPSTRTAALVGGAWIGAAILAITLNGRDLPQYFVQATPALAFAGGTGLWAAWQSRHLVLRGALVALVVVGFWRVGTEAPVKGIARLAGLPGLAHNVAFDAAYWRGTIDRRTYLARFGGDRPQDKFAALDLEDLAAQVVARTTPDDRILVFGFSPGVYVKADRESASRFFWSYPVVFKFASDRAGYGSAGLLEDLTTTQPALVILQRADGAPDSLTFFNAQPALSTWLTAHYHLVDDTGRYAIWERSPQAGGPAEEDGR